MRAAVIGAGSFGTALAAALGPRMAVRLWARRAALAEELARTGRNGVYLPDVALPPAVEPTASLDHALIGATLVMFAVPSQAMRETLVRVAPKMPAGALGVSTAKGLDLRSLKRMSEVGSEFGLDLAQLSGPSHAEEVGHGLGTVVVLAHPDEDVRRMAQELISGPALRVYRSADRLGVELAGAFKNVIALAAGILEGVGGGDNLRAALLTRGLAEITRLGVALGARPETFAGLAGLGDLMVTAISGHSRNRRAGLAIGRGEAPADVLAASPMVVEGVPACRAALALGARVDVEMPIAEALGRILFEQAEVHAEVTRLLQRTLKAEETWPA